MVLRRLLSNAASRFDETVGAAMLIRGGDRSLVKLHPSEPHEARLAFLEEVCARYSTPTNLDAPEAFFPLPAAANPTLARVRAIGNADGGRVLDATWTSDFAPAIEAVRDEYLAIEQNHTAAARLFLHTNPRPAAILVHGYRCGQYALEERIWPIDWLFSQGLDLALVVLPFHAMRAPGKKTSLFPSPDPRFTIEGFRQAIADLAGLEAFFRSRGAPAVGVMGMSLGGYTAGLYATVARRLDFVVPIIPCVSIADVARIAGMLVGTEEEQREIHAALEAALWVTSPLARPPRLPKDRILIIGGDADRITPLEHARRLADHFNAPLERFHGGHLLQFGRADAFRAIGKMLDRLKGDWGFAPNPTRGCAPLDPRWGQ